ncbi:hypothetical protein FPQ18DRAFT_316722 [Pyronema domesticum]|nr:hypothetical protein FPQ18DRAFT_316722 [Pyronema domesticum]
MDLYSVLTLPSVRPPFGLWWCLLVVVSQSTRKISSRYITIDEQLIILKTHVMTQGNSCGAVVSAPFLYGNLG